MPPSEEDKTLSELEDVRDRLVAIAEELADLALDRLRAASGEEEDQEALRATLAEERRITRARRSVEKAAELLQSE
jgi:hypothetical protein